METETSPGYESPSILDSTNVFSIEPVSHPGHEVSTPLNVVNDQFIEIERHAGPETPSPSNSANLPTTDLAPCLHSGNQRTLN